MTRSKAPSIVAGGNALLHSKSMGDFYDHMMCKLSFLLRVEASHSFSVAFSSALLKIISRNPRKQDMERDNTQD